MYASRMARMHVDAVYDDNDDPDRDVRTGQASPTAQTFLTAWLTHHQWCRQMAAHDKSSSSWRLTCLQPGSA